VDAVKDVWFGGAPMSGEIARKVVESFRKPVKVKDADLEQLTNREEEVLALLAKGYITKEIADQMNISFDTVRFHLKHIYQKLHVRSRSEALIKYLK
jgi:DNA-binding NarL/FixJ family response regulator